MKFLYKKRNRKHIKDYEVTLEDIKSSKTILFSMFGRYGDVIIGFSICLEFIKKYPNKKYVFIVSPQHYPYIYECVKDMDNVLIFTFKKNNILKLIYLLNKLYKLHPDLAFNPFSWSDESEFFITFAKKFSFFKNQKFYFYDNYYNIMRKYLKLELKQIKLYDIKYDFKNILICPESSENRRSLTIEQIKFLINKYKDKHITLAVNKKIKINENINQFLFSKKNSKEFLNLIKKSDIIMCVDSAPLHIAMLYDKQIIAFFSSSSPRRVLNSDKYVLPVRNNVLYGVECEDKTCNEAICLDFIKERFDKYTLETKRTKLIYNCPIKKENIESVY